VLRVTYLLRLLTHVQLDMTYELRLRLYGSNNHHAVISNESNVINITVLANNFPFGLFSFPHANYSVTVGKTILMYVLTADTENYFELDALSGM